jgi:hypothetical protein
VPCLVGLVGSKKIFLFRSYICRQLTGHCDSDVFVATNHEAESLLSKRVRPRVAATDINLTIKILSQPRVGIRGYATRLDSFVRKRYFRARSAMSLERDPTAAGNVTEINAATRFSPPAESRATLKYLTRTGYTLRSRRLGKSLLGELAACSG